MPVLRKGSCRRVALLTLAAVASVWAPAAAQRVFRSGVDLVNFGVTVTDRRGNLVRGLTAADFEVVEEGRPQTIQYFIEGDGAQGADNGMQGSPLHLGLLFDTSGSMGEDIKFSRTAVIKFLNALFQAADITLVDFDTEVRVARYSQAEVPRLIERIRLRKPDGWTALYDAVGVYLAGAQDQDGRKVLVIYTDGGDTRSATSFSDVMDMLKLSDVTAYVVGFLEHQPGSVRMDQRMRLQQVALATGGIALFPHAKEQLDEMYAKILEEIRGRYTLGYLSSNERADGGWRGVKIRVRRPDLKDVKVRTRGGYFAPLRQGSK
jgi:Ca-activated chloride channel family protein